MRFRDNIFISNARSVSTCFDHFCAVVCGRQPSESDPGTLQKPENLWFGTFSFRWLYKKEPKTKISWKWRSRRDPHLVQKSVPEVTKIDQKWCLGGVFCAFWYIHKTLRFTVLLASWGPKRWQKDVKMEVQKVVSKHTENLWNSTKTLYSIVFLAPSNAQERSKRVQKGCFFNCGKHVQSHFWGPIWDPPRIDNSSIWGPPKKGILSWGHPKTVGLSIPSLLGGPP